MSHLLSLPNEKLLARPNLKRLPWSVFNLFVKGGVELKATFGNEDAHIYSNYYFSADQVAKYLHFKRNKPRNNFFGQMEYLNTPARKSTFYLQRKKLESPTPTPNQNKANSSSPSKKSSSKVDIERSGHVYKPKTLHFLIDGYSKPKVSKSIQNSLTSLFEESTNPATQDSRPEAESFELSVNIYDHGRNFVDHEHAAQDNSPRSSGKSDRMALTLWKTGPLRPIESAPRVDQKPSPCKNPRKQESPLSKIRQQSRNEKASSTCALHRLTKEILRYEGQLEPKGQGHKPILNRKFSSNSRLNRTLKTSFISPGVSSIIKRYAVLTSHSLQSPSPRAIATTENNIFFSNTRTHKSQYRQTIAPIEPRKGTANNTSGVFLQSSFQSQHSKPSASSRTFFSSTLRSLKEY